MGHFVGLADKQFFVDDDGKVYGSPAKGVMVAENVEELIAAAPAPQPLPVAEKQEGMTDDLVTCDICGFKTTKAAMGMHKKKHKGIF